MTTLGILFQFPQVNLCLELGHEPHGVFFNGQQMSVMSSKEGQGTSAGALDINWNVKRERS